MIPEVKAMPPKPKEPTPMPFRLTLGYLATVFFSWLVPGAGHVLLGYRVRGALLGASILGLFWFGQVLAMPSVGTIDRTPMAVSRKVSPVFFGCQAGNGLSALLSEALWGQSHYENNLEPIDRFLPRHLNLGILFTSVSGLLNLLVVLQILDPRTWAQVARERMGLDPVPPGAETVRPTRGAR